jgi:hypothetical protein
VGTDSKKAQFRRNDTPDAILPCRNKACWKRDLLTVDSSIVVLREVMIFAETDMQPGFYPLGEVCAS